MADFSTWDRATLEQFAQEATDKLVANNDYAAKATAANIMQRERIAALESELAELRKAQGEPVAWMHPITGAVVKADMKIPGVTLDDFTIPLYTSAPAIPEGWQLVPVEPTEDMVYAAIVAADEKPLSDWGKIVDLTYYETYLAMLAAAPKHTQRKRND